MPIDIDANLAADLIAAGERSIQEVLFRIGERIKVQTIHNIPVGDPENPGTDPDFHLRDHVFVRQYGNFVSISVEGDYALKQHENQSFKHPRGGQAKYLERAVAVMLGQLGPMMVGTLQRQFVDMRGGRRRDRLVETNIRPKV
jgi:hypothetical protein